MKFSIGLLKGSTTCITFSTILFASILLASILLVSPTKPKTVNSVPSMGLTSTPSLPIASINF